jgi:hypothetical protein
VNLSGVFNCCKAAKNDLVENDYVSGEVVDVNGGRYMD